jgi:hypothetical protein
LLPQRSDLPRPARQGKHFNNPCYTQIDLGGYSFGHPNAARQANAIAHQTKCEPQLTSLVLCQRMELPATIALHACSSDGRKISQRHRREGLLGNRISPLFATGRIAHHQRLELWSHEEVK